MRTALLLLLAFALHVPASAQWQRLPIPDFAYPTDFTIRHGVILIGRSEGTNAPGMYRSADAGATWTQPYINTGSSTRPLPGAVNAVVGLPSGFLADSRKSAGPDGAAWTQELSERPGLEGFNVYRFHYETKTQRVLYAVNYAPAVGAPALARSLDNGATWTTMTGPFTRLSFVHARGDTLLAGVAVGGGWFSTNGGATWTSLADRGIGGATVGGFIDRDGSLYVNVALPAFFSGTSELWRSRDGGATWTKLTGSITPQPRDVPNSRANLVYAEGPKILFSGGCAFYVSLNDGASWTEKSEGMTACYQSGSPTGGITQSAFSGGFLYVLRQQTNSARGDWGLYRRPLSELGLSGPVAAAADARADALNLRLSPNPARAGAHATFALSAPASVRLTLFDALGRAVHTLAEATYPGGAHTLALSTDGLPGGVYLVRLDAGGAVVTRPLVVAR